MITKKLNPNPDFSKTVNPNPILIRPDLDPNPCSSLISINSSGMLELGNSKPSVVLSLIPLLCCKTRELN